MENTYNNLKNGLKKYFADNGFSQSVIALSGGIDSAVVVAIAAAALGKENVRVLLLPSRFSSTGSVDDSVEMAKRLGLRYDIISIEPAFESALGSLEGVFKGTESGLAEENMQSRLRMMFTMAVANKFGALMLNTSNRTEIMVGYGTLYGDTCGAISVIGSLYKDEVYALARYINETEGDVIPNEIIEKVPSAELREGQKDSDSLPEYDVLDAVLRLMVDNNMSVDEIVDKGYDRGDVERIERLNSASAFKRSQFPPVLAR